MTDDEIVDFVKDKHDIPLATGVYRKAHLDLVSMAREEERTAIVAWLRGSGDPVIANWISAQIEQGDYK